MILRKAILWQFLIFLASMAVSAVVSASLPDRVPIHWNIRGTPDAWGSKWTNLLMMPGFLLGLVVMTIVLPSISPKGFRLDSFGQTYGYIMVLLAAMLLAMHLVILQASAHAGLDVGRVLTGILLLFFALMGNVLGRVKRNFWVGIRTPWTLADERVWTATHRSAGRLWLIGGLIGAIAVLAGAPAWLGFADMIAIALFPVAQSYFVYKKLSGI